MARYQKENNELGRNRFFEKVNSLRSFEDLETEQIEELEQINNTEVLNQNVNSFLDDLRNLN